jgi:hypothetical protein
MIDQGLSEVVLGVFNGVGSALGIIGTLIYPIFVKRLGLIRTGAIGFWSEFSMLIFCVLSLFVYGTTFGPFKNFTIGSCHIYATTNNTGTTNIIPYLCLSRNLSVYLLAIGITCARFGKFF